MSAKLTQQVVDESEEIAKLMGTNKTKVIRTIIKVLIDYISEPCEEEEEEADQDKDSVKQDIKDALELLFAK